MKKHILFFSFIFFIAPASTNYTLRSHTFSSGGEVGQSSNYSIESTLGEVSGDRANSSSYQNLQGLLYVQMANTPPAPTFVSSNDYTNKLLLTLDSANNPSDSQFAIAISTDNFTTTQYLQSDNTVGSVLGSEDWQTYADWGGSSGEFIIGLLPDTTYYVKVKARQGDYTEGPWGPTTSASTSALSISFDIDVSITDTETSSPYTLSLGSLSPGNVTTSTEKIWVDFSTNAPGGGYIYVLASNNGLYSQTNNYTISAVSGNLSSLEEGFGIQSDTLSESSGGPFLVSTPYDGSGEVVGTVTTQPQEIFNTSSQPIVNGRANFVTKAKVDELTPAATDYSNTITIISAATF